MMTKIEQITHVLLRVWEFGGYTFGGTSRDMLRGEMPNDLDVWLPRNADQLDLPGGTKEERPAERGEAYYDYRLVTPELSVDVKTRWVEVTDIDVNLILYGAKELKLLYVPRYLKSCHNPLAMVLRNIRLKQFQPLEECAEHRRYRWQKFEERGWKNLAKP